MGVKTPFIIKMAPLRGNVTTRVKKLTDGDYDAIILAMAGLNRLGLDISHLPKMVLPLDVCPTAPAQGALAIECRADDAKTREILSALHHAPTAAHIAREREVLQRFGGGCHQAFGATSLDLAPNMPMTFVRGKSDAGEPLDHIEWQAPQYKGNIIAWDGTAHRKDSQTTSIHHSPITNHAIFAAHHRAVPEGFPQPQRLWCAGVMSWQKLAERGYWVEGCAENLGIDHIKEMLGDLNDWTVLTHEDAGHGIATYAITPSPAEAEGLAEATHIFWGSGSQFLRLKHLATKATHHACGAGKTAEVLRTHGITPDIFPNRKEWNKATNIRHCEER